MERGANTFPFHNLLPYSESNEGLFLFFSPSLNWIKEKSVATLAIRTFAIQKSQSQFTVLHLSFERVRYSFSLNFSTCFLLSPFLTLASECLAGTPHLSPTTAAAWAIDDPNQLRSVAPSVGKLVSLDLSFKEPKQTLLCRHDRPRR